jgi:hypothetical protein
MNACLRISSCCMHGRVCFIQPRYTYNLLRRTAWHGTSRRVSLVSFVATNQLLALIVGDCPERCLLYCFSFEPIKALLIYVCVSPINPANSKSNQQPYIVLPCFGAIAHTEWSGMAQCMLDSLWALALFTFELVLDLPP